MAVGELLLSGTDGESRAHDAWTLLAALCEPYLDQGQAANAAALALDIAEKRALFKGEVKRHDLHIGAFETLRLTARKAVEDMRGIPAPEQRLAVGKLLGTGPRLDDRPGVGVRGDGLPDIAWRMIPDVDPTTKQPEFIYQQDERRTERIFWMARYPITHAQFQAFLDARDQGFDNPIWWAGLAVDTDHRAQPGEQGFKYWNHPRENVSWYDAIAFCRWLTARAAERTDLLPKELDRGADWEITLPTEWQWEKAARGYDGRQYPWGDAYQSGSANVNETYDNRGPYYLGQTSAVGMYPEGKSPFEVEEMSGNVWEWCLNEHEKPDNFGVMGDADRVLRGGSWFSNVELASALVRYRPWPDPRSRYGAFGFRVVVVGVPVQPL